MEALMQGNNRDYLASKVKKTLDIFRRVGYRADILYPHYLFDIHDIDTVELFAYLEGDELDLRVLFGHVPPPIGYISRQSVASFEIAGKDEA
jgi:hypothetical protein